MTGTDKPGVSTPGSSRKTRSQTAAEATDPEKPVDDSAVTAAAQALTMMSSSDEGDKPTPAVGSPQKEPEDDDKGKETAVLGDIQVVSVSKEVRSNEELAQEAQVLEERRTKRNRERDEKEKERRIRALRRPKMDKNKVEAINKARREKYREQIRRREADEAEKEKLGFDRERKAAKSARDRADTRRRELPMELNALIRRKKIVHSLKRASLVRGDPLVVLENPRTREISVQVSVDHLPRLMAGQWLNQTIIDWFVCLATSDKPQFLPMGTDFYRLMSDSKKGGPRSVIDHHRRMEKRGVPNGDDFCALESATVVLAPVNVDENHWVLVVVNTKERSIQYYDSLGPGPTGTSSARRIIRNFWDWVELQERRRNGTMDNWEPVYVQGLPRRTNTYDCGVHVCDFVQMIVSGGDISTLTCTDEKGANEFRAGLLIHMLEAALLSY